MFKLIFQQIFSGTRCHTLIGKAQLKLQMFDNILWRFVASFIFSWISYPDLQGQEKQPAQNVLWWVMGWDSHSYKTGPQSC